MQGSDARADQYRDKAEEVRTIADTMTSTELRQILMTVVGDYLMLAELLEHAEICEPVPAVE